MKNKYAYLDDAKAKQMQKKIAKYKREKLALITIAIATGVTFSLMRTSSTIPSKHKMETTSQYLQVSAEHTNGAIAAPHNLFTTLPIYLHLKGEYSEKEIQEAKKSCDAWNNAFKIVNSKLRIELSQDGYPGLFDAGNIYVYKDDIDGLEIGRAIPRVRKNAENDAIYGGLIVLDSRQIEKLNTSTSNVLIHEIGHLIGFAHSDDPEACMYDKLIELPNANYILTPEEMKLLATFVTKNTSKKNLEKIKTNIEEYAKEYEQYKGERSIYVMLSEKEK